MRSFSVAVVLLVLAPGAGALFAPPAFSPALPDDLSDADLLRLLAREVGLQLDPMPQVVIPAGATVPLLVTQLGVRAGLPETDGSAFADLHPLVAQPVLTMLVAMDIAWTMRDQAYAKLSPAELEELSTLDPIKDAERASALSAQIDRRELFESAILLLDTLESVVIPGVNTAVNAGVWPPVAVADPSAPCAMIPLIGRVCPNSGVLRLGSGGTDKETVNRVLQIDPAGEDYYYNNAGGGQGIMDPLRDNWQAPVAMSVDLAGNDHYRANESIHVAQGGSGIGVGILLDTQGNDEYRCGDDCQGGGKDGLGFFRDMAGNDTYHAVSYAGAGTTLIGILREDAGNDTYLLHFMAGGAATRDDTLGLLWDRAGTDRYDDWGNVAIKSYGYAYQGGRGWLVDEGTPIDYYLTAADPLYPHGCNDCTWLAGTPGNQPANGRGNDNAGGLAALLSEPGALPT